MKNNLLLAAAAVLLGLFTSVSRANVPSPAPAQGQPTTQTFIGEISRYPGDRYPVPYVIYDETRKADYFLDDNDKAANYDEKRVEITGTLDERHNTIKVKSMKEVK